MRIIAVEEALTPVAEALQNRGYSVVGFREGDLGRAEALVVSGQDDNIMGIQNIRSRAPVINAEGRTPDDVVREIEERLGS